MNVYQAIRHRRSVRAYLPTPIPPDALSRLREALRWAPSACNLQPWRFIFISDPSRRLEVARLCRQQLWMAQAPLTMVACGLVDQAYKRMGGYASSIDIDVAIAVDHLTLAAVTEGLGTCWIGAFDEAALKHLLQVPAGVKIVALTPVGYPASPDLLHPLDDSQRKPPSQVFDREQWGQP